MRDRHEAERRRIIEMIDLILRRMPLRPAQERRLCRARQTLKSSTRCRSDAGMHQIFILAADLSGLALELLGEPNKNEQIG